MSAYMKAAGKWGSIFVVLALVITLLKQIIGFIGFLTTIIKVGIVLLFVAILIGVALLFLKSMKNHKPKED